MFDRVSLFMFKFSFSQFKEADALKARDNTDKE